MCYSTLKNKYVQVRQKSGGGLRVVEVNPRIDLPGIIRKGIDVFYDVISKANTEYQLGTFGGSIIERFTNANGMCSYVEYLKSRGIFSSRYYMYLMVRASASGREIT